MLLMNVYRRDADVCVCAVEATGICWLLEGRSERLEESMCSLPASDASSEECPASHRPVRSAPPLGDCP